MQKKITTILMATLVAGVIAIGAVYASNNLTEQQSGKSATGDNLQTAGAEQFCQTREQALAKTDGKLQVKEPTYLPAGYKFACADVIPDDSPEMALMFYGNGTPLEKEKANRNDLIANGAILVATKHADPEVTDRKSEIEHSFNDGINPALKTRLIEINGNIAAVREQCQDWERIRDLPKWNYSAD
jgi:hypothetical protein